MSKHTPGPWTINDARDGQSVLFQIESSVQADKPEVIVAMLDDGNTSVSEQRANAHLIAAAPELLDAVKDLRDYLAEYEPDGGELAQRVAQIIAKAEGRL